MSMGLDSGVGPARDLRHTGDGSFLQLAHAVQRTFAAALVRGERRLFRVRPSQLEPDWNEHYLGAFGDAVERQWHNCACCRAFLRRYGGLVTIDERGVLQSALWDEAEVGGDDVRGYREVVGHLRRLAERGVVESELVWKSGRWGVEMAGNFNHFHLGAGPGRGVATLTEGQEMAQRRQDYVSLELAVRTMRDAAVLSAVGMLLTGQLAGSDKLLPMARFLSDLQGRITTYPRKRPELIWRAVAHGSRGWCSPRGSAFGALVEDIERERPLDAIIRAHNERLDPLHYQRPQAPPSAGNIRQAEKLVETLGIARSLARRPMALTEAVLSWKPQQPAPPKSGDGVFGHLKAKPGPLATLQALSVQAVNITLAKLVRDILPAATSMELLTPSLGDYCALTTAVHSDAPPLMRWDALERRNPGGWYVHTRGSTPDSWGLPVRSWVPVLGVCALPSEWTHEGREQLSRGKRLFILEGAKDARNVTSALFPELLRSELHGVRATIEAHSKVTPLEDEDRPRASGYLLGMPNQRTAVQVRVVVMGGTAVFNVDRAD